MLVSLCCGVCVLDNAHDFRAIRQHEIPAFLVGNAMKLHTHATLDRQHIPIPKRRIAHAVNRGDLVCKRATARELNLLNGSGIHDVFHVSVFACRDVTMILWRNRVNTQTQK